MGFVNKGEWDSDNADLPDAMRGYNLPKPNGDLVVDLNSVGLLVLLFRLTMDTLNVQNLMSLVFMIQMEIM